MTSNSGRLHLLKINTITSLFYQFTSVAYGLILPILYLKYYGSEINGLVTSISQFLGIIVFLEFGVGAVVQSALYKPLATFDYTIVKQIMEEAKTYFRRIAYVLIVYVILLLFIYPHIINNVFSFFTTSFLILATALNLFSQYFFGITNQILLISDQKTYINYGIQIGILFITGIMSVILIKLGTSIEIVKLITAFTLLFRPLLLHLYVKKHYSFVSSIYTKTKFLTQKWSGVAHHISYVIVEQTDVIVLTAFSTLYNVSVYYIYYIVILGIRQLLIYASTGIQSLLGNIFAVEDSDYINNAFNQIEWIFHAICTSLFTITGILIIPFVKVYTRNIIDVNYILPTFAMLMVTAQYFYSIRQPYYMLMRAAGHYKQTQISAIIEAIINVLVSIVLVNTLGLVGVAIGTLSAMIFRTLHLVFYLRKNIVNRPIKFFLKQIFVNILGVILTIAATRNILLTELSYLHWFFLAVKVSLICISILTIINYIFYKKEIVDSLKFIKNAIQLKT
ncbi:MAG: sugar isomerase [Tenericutes bacterium HGW-Tenericutes-1]|jgi:hypothetical protein|nr:MAG: sugar isomerase [Tenericutes bacterium HGW-Tenericutes-1]